MVREFIIRKQHPVYRFFSQEYHTHFYTISEAEKDYIIASYAPSVWNYEGIAYQAMNVPDADVTQPLYRFWSQTNRKHFYTADAYEKEHLINGAYPEAQFVYEGIAWYTNVSQTTATRPLYRFYSPVYRAHFYTISEEERDVVIERYAPIIWTYEGVAWYALK